MVVDFKKILLIDLYEKKEYKDVSKELGNLIYKYTGDIGEMDIARKIYHDGTVELTVNQVISLRELINTLPIRAYLKSGILKQFDENGTNE